MISAVRLLFLGVVFWACMVSAYPRQSSRFLRTREKLQAYMKRDVPDPLWIAQPEMEGLEPVDVSSPAKWLAHKETSQSTRAEKRNSPIDLRQTGLLRDIDDQGECGSCYAFAGVHSVQDDHHLSIGRRVPDASIQHVVACCSNCAARAADYCSGGYPNRIANFMGVNGAPYDSCQPYKSYYGQVAACQKESSSCQSQSYGSYQGPANSLVDGIKSQLSKKGVMLTSFYVPHDFVAFFDANPRGVYPKGVRAPESKISTVGGHAVEIVGWGIDGGRDYWIVKNSYGSGWGENGYFKWDVADSRVYSLVNNVVLTSSYSYYKRIPGSNVRQEEEQDLAPFGSDEYLGGLVNADNDDEVVQEAAEFAIGEIQNTLGETCNGNAYVLDKVLDTQVQQVRGDYYHIYLQATTPDTKGLKECTQQYHAHVVVNLEGTFVLAEFRSVEPEVGFDLSTVENDEDEDEGDEGDEGDDDDEDEGSGVGIVRMSIGVLGAAWLVMGWLF